jgi:hypothetical protein
VTTGSVTSSASLVPPASAPARARARLTEALDEVVSELARVGVNAVGFRIGDDRDPRPGVWVDGRGWRAGMERAFHAAPRTILLRDRREKWVQAVATLARGVEA